LFVVLLPKGRGSHFIFVQPVKMVCIKIKIILFFSIIETIHRIEILHLQFVFLEGSRKQNENSQEKKGEKVESLGRIKLTHYLPASVEDAIELKVEERGVGVP